MNENTFQPEKKIVFVVDDVLSNLLIAKDALKDSYRVITFDSAAKLFAFLLKIKPDLILLDIEMPKVNGFQVLKELKEDKANKDIPVIFVTSEGTAANVSKAAVSGADDFIVKPYEPDALLEKVESLFAKASPAGDKTTPS